MDEFTLSNLLGALLVLVGLWLVITGAPSVAVAAGTGIWDLLVEIFKEYPRVAIGIVLIIVGGIFLGVDFGPVFGGGGDDGGSTTTGAFGLAKSAWAG